MSSVGSRVSLAPGAAVLLPGSAPAGVAGGNKKAKKRGTGTCHVTASGINKICNIFLRRCSTGCCQHDRVLLWSAGELTAYCMGTSSTSITSSLLAVAVVVALPRRGVARGLRRCVATALVCLLLLFWCVRAAGSGLPSLSSPATASANSSWASGVSASGAWAICVVCAVTACPRRVRGLFVLFVP
jgi:hypothetical protein